MYGLKVESYTKNPLLLFNSSITAKLAFKEYSIE